jgi:alpha-methylacyl-CoA racemase
MSGPLQGLRVLEVAGIGPGPFAAMMLADLGAEVVRIDRPAQRRPAADDGTGRAAADPRRYVMHRGRRSVAVDLRHPDGVATVLRLIEQADALIEGFRPGTMERLGLGPEECLRRNPRLIYGRMTGWGQDGPLAAAAGHDIDYIAVAGALHCFARAGQPPVPPVNIVGDIGGGGMFLVVGLLSALWEASRSGQGQVVDAAMVDGAAVLTTMLYGLLAQGRWRDVPGTNFGDTGAPYYDVYTTADGRYIAVGALEEPFYAELIGRLGLDDAELPNRHDRSQWPVLRARLADVFRTRSRDEWCAVFEGSDACVAPVLSLSEAPRHPQSIARQTFVDKDGLVQPAPAPRFSRTPTHLEIPPPLPGEHTDEVLTAWGIEPAEVTRLRESGAVA